MPRSRLASRPTIAAVAGRPVVRTTTVTFGTATAGISIDRTLPFATATATTTNKPTLAWNRLLPR